MAGTAKSNASQRQAAHLVAMGYPHGKRASKPQPGSGGLPGLDTKLSGSAAARRLQVGSTNKSPSKGTYRAGAKVR